MRDLLNVSAAHDDALSLGMFWAGALMVFAPVIFAGIVLAVWWRHRPRPIDDEEQLSPPSAHA